MIREIELVFVQKFIRQLARANIIKMHAFMPVLMYHILFNLVYLHYLPTHTILFIFKYLLATLDILVKISV